MDYKYISITPTNDEAADGELLDLYLKSIQNNSVYKDPYVLKNKKESKSNSKHLF